MFKCKAPLVSVLLIWLTSCAAPPQNPDLGISEAAAARGQSGSQEPASGDPGTQDPAAQDPTAQDPTAQDPTAQEPTQEPPPFTPPAPNPKDFDWIKMSSGEWLKGDITAMSEDSLEFDSADLDELSIDWGDVAEVRSPRTNMLGFTERRTETGTMRIVGDDIIIGTAQGERRYKRSELLSIVPGEMKEANYWSGGISLGISNQSGNTEQFTVNAKANVMRRTTESRVRLDYIGNIGRANNIENVNNHRLPGRWDLFVSRKWFVTPLSVDLLHDRFQNIAFQATPAAGVGYHLIDTSTVAWDLTLAGGYRFTQFESAPAGGDETQGVGVAVPGLSLDWDITGDVEWSVNYSLELGVTDIKATNQHLVTTLSIDIYGDFDLDLTFQWDRIGDPQPNASGVTPQPSDFRTSVGLGWEF